MKINKDILQTNIHVLDPLLKWAQYLGAENYMIDKVEWPDLQVCLHRVILDTDRELDLHGQIRRRFYDVVESPHGDWRKDMYTFVYNPAASVVRKELGGPSGPE